MVLPGHFCWTRFGTEAAQSIDQILARKEEERIANNGTFLWGIGNAIGPSMKELVRRAGQPEVLFSPIKSPARNEDAAPASVVAWTTGEGLFGELFQLPARSLVTSRHDLSRPRNSHYALVCFSKEPLRLSNDHGSINVHSLRNLLTGRPVGASQVTAVVERETCTVAPNASYAVSIRAQLVYPFLIRLQDPIPVSARGSNAFGEQAWSEAVKILWDRRIASGPQLALSGLSTARRE
jgi:hypothetical protein